MKAKRIKGIGTYAKTRARIRIIIIAFFIFLSYLAYNLFNLGIILHAYYEEKVYDQITTTSTLTAGRGNIYDRNMALLAGTDTVWRVFISTRDIKKAEKEEGREYSLLIAAGLSEILGLNNSRLLEKIKGSSKLDVTVKKSVTEDEYCAVLDFITKNSLERLVFTEAQSSRYYPNATLAAHTIGFCGSDNQGLYGLEYYYDDWLRGKDGYYLYSKDANGNALSTEYSTYVPAESGHNLVTTIDSYVQSVLEGQLAQTVLNNSVTNRATGVVMDVNTGAILAMATSSPYDPNAPYELDDISKKKLENSGLAEGSEEYKALKKELLEVMWSNKAVSETYEPGSTFKIVTVCAALDLGVARVSDTFSCIGYHNVGGWRIKCHKTKGHGSGFNLAYGLQMSCNPTMMVLGERIGQNGFYSYIEEFGYLTKSGVDLPSEARTIFHELENIGPTELATISFGQRFKVTVINHLSAICAVANGGNEITPYLVDKIIDKDGKAVYEHEAKKGKQIISKEVADTVSRILADGVSGDGGAKNAAVDGYDIAAKTGTSQKFDVLDENGNSYLRIGSTVAYNISEDGGGIAIIIVVDEPQSTVKYGSVVAAPYVSAALTDILPYLDYKPNTEKSAVSVPDCVGLSVSDAKKLLDEKELKYEVIGNGEIVLSQTPTKKDTVTSSLTTVLLYTNKESESTTVPALVGKEISEAVKLCVDNGLNIKISGSTEGGTVTSQSLPSGAIVKKGAVIELKVLVYDFED